MTPVAIKGLNWFEAPLLSFNVSIQARLIIVLSN